MNRSRLALLAALALAAALPGCMSGGRRGGAADGGQPAAEGNQAPTSDDATGEVVLSGADLAPVDAWVRRRRWILGDDVTVVASREYFAPLLSITERIGLVARQDSVENGESVTTLTYAGPAEQIDVQTAPRVMIGTGITVMARRRLVVRLARTTQVAVPIRIDIRADGKASTGVASEVMQRAAALSISAGLRRGGAGRYVFEGN